MPAAHGHAAGSARVRRKKAHGGGHEEGGAERWLVTYADMLTLLLVLFIVLFSISVVNTSKFIQLKTALSNVFGDGPTGTLGGGLGLLQTDATGSGKSLVTPGQPIAEKAGGGAVADSSDAAARAELREMQRRAGAADEKTDFRRVQAELTAALGKAGLSKAVRFAIDRRGLVITVVTDALVFPGNSAQLLPRGEKILRIVAPPLARESRAIEVDGHTNQQRVSTGPYPSGWELSTARASSVVRYLVANGVAAKRLTAVGYSDQRPLYPASDPRSITMNRRVEIVVLTRQPTQESP